MLGLDLTRNARTFGRRRAIKFAKKLLVTVTALALSAPAAHATYNTNLTGNVSAIMTYTSGILLFTLTNQPTSNGSCNAIYFEVDPSNVVSDAAFDRMYARLAQAYATGEQVNVGFDGAANCGVGGYIQVYRIG
jgi:hypothetical protein